MVIDFSSFLLLLTIFWMWFLVIIFFIFIIFFPKTPINCQFSFFLSFHLCFWFHHGRQLFKVFVPQKITESWLQEGAPKSVTTSNIVVPPLQTLPLHTKNVSPNWTTRFAKPLSQNLHILLVQSAYSPSFYEGDQRL